MINLDNIDEIKFEELCYDLLLKIGFKNLNWRKGTGKKGNTSDSGRDIEASLIITDIDGTVYEEKWYVECKYYTKGVPVQKISNAVDYAVLEKVDKLLIITSSFLSNACKIYLEKVKTNSSLKIKVWENKDLENLLNNHIDLLHKYKLNKSFNEFELMNPYHISYITKLQNNTLEYFFKILEKLDQRKREEIFDLTYRFFSEDYGTGEIAESINAGKKIKQKKIYGKFIKKCRQSLKTTSDIFLVNSIVNVTLQILFNFGNICNIEKVLEYREEFLRKFLTLGLDANMTEKEVEENIESDESNRDLIDFFQRMNDELPQRTKEANELYNYFCNNVVAELLKENYLYN